jgi:D-alanyl-D-alanine carboxypeptidase
VIRRARPWAILLPALSLLAASAWAAVDYENVETEPQPAAAEAAASAPESPASAPEAPEAPTPFNRPEVDALLRRKGVWGYQFVWVKADGTRVVLSEKNPDRPMIPASTMKLFTGYFGFLLRAKPLGELSEMLHKSLNARANELLAACGGSKALKKFLEGLGFKLGRSLNVVDGSGFDARNRATARLQVDLLEHILRSNDYAAFKVLLAQPGQEGTLEDRLTELSGSVFAKTGTLPYSGDIALAGYVEQTNGTVIFSIMGNGLTHKSIPWARAAIDSAVRLHGGYVARYGPTKRSAPAVVSSSVYRDLTVYSPAGHSNFAAPGLQ